MALPRFSPAFQILSPSRDPVTSPFFSFSFSSPPSSPRLKGRALSLGSRRSRTWRRAASAVGPTEEVLFPAAEAEAEEERVEYDWREEWYPLYLSDEVPKDAPLGLNVFDKKLVLFRDGNGSFCCFEDRCPHRLAKLSEGQLIDGRLECLYHGWQFGDGGKCLKIPQLPEGAKIPRSACAKTYKVRDSQGVVWVWMSNETAPSSEKLPYFEYYSRPDFQAISTIHELPYDHSIVLENFMDPAHVPISHDRSDFYSKREDAQPLLFETTERSPRGFAGKWIKSRKPAFTNFLRFEAPCALQNNHEYVDKTGKKQYVSSLFLCRPTGQGKSMVIIRFGTTLKSPVMKFLPTWFFHQNICKVFEQDMGFLSSQNEILMKEKIPVGKLYLNLRSCDTWVLEYRKWKDRVGHGMPHYFGNGSISLPKEPAVVEHSPAGLAAGISASMPAKGGSREAYAPNPINRYFRHIVHCKECGSSVKAFGFWSNVLVCLAIVALSSAIVASRTQWKVLFLVSAALFLAGQYVCYLALNLVATNFIRNHRRL